MDAVFDGEAVQSVTTTCGGTNNITNKTTAGSNRLGIVSVGGTQFAGPPYVTGITWAGVAMTLVGEVSATGQFASLWAIKDPPTAASTIAVTNACALGGAVASSYNGVDTTGSAPYTRASSLATATGANSGVSNTPSASATGDIVIDAIGIYNTSPSTTGTNTKRGEAANSVNFAATSDAPGANTPPAMTWDSHILWSSVVASWAAAGGGATTVSPRKALLGVGL